MKLTGSLLRSGVKSLCRFWLLQVGDRLFGMRPCANMSLEQQCFQGQGPIIRSLKKGINSQLIYRRLLVTIPCCSELTFVICKVDLIYFSSWDHKFMLRTENMLQWPLFALTATDVKVGTSSNCSHFCLYKQEGIWNEICLYSFCHWQGPELLNEEEGQQQARARGGMRVGEG